MKKQQEPMYYETNLTGTPKYFITTKYIDNGDGTFTALNRREITKEEFEEAKCEP